MFPIFQNDTCEASINLLIEVLECIFLDGSYQIVNISNGVIIPEGIEQLYEVCHRLSQNHTIIVSAYDNSSIMTYPACFDCVIGIDKTDEIHNRKDYIWNDNSPVNICGYADLLRVPWIGNKFVLASGTSFLCPYITSIISEALYNGEEVGNVLRGKAKNCVYQYSQDVEKIPFDIKKGIIFPFNKEMHALARFSNELSWSIEGIFDIKYSPNLGKIPNEFSEQKEKYRIKAVGNIDWNDNFDTLIIGHIRKIREIMGNDFVCEIVYKAIKNNKNIYTYDRYVKKCFEDFVQNFSNRKSKCFYPTFKIGNLSGSFWGKMWIPSLPVIAVMGTNSKQGKYTLQLQIKQELLISGYKVAHLSTEPNGLLIGANAIFHFGDNNLKDTSEKAYILYINQLIHNIESSDKFDIILTGSQSNTIPDNLFIGNNLTVAQSAFLHGTASDAVILAVSPEDDTDYILRTINYIESYIDTKVIGITIFPMERYVTPNGTIGSRNISGTDKIRCKICELENNYTGIIVEHDETAAKKLSNEIISYLSEE